MDSLKGLYPFKFTPILKDKIWGGKKLEDILGKKIAPLPNAGESWEISGVEGDVSTVANGFLAGNDLQDLIEVYMGELVGDSVYESFGTEFPLLIKFIDANDDLSIQVHPDDTLSKERHNAFGKTEMWYVVQADKGSTLISGFSKEVTKEEYVKAVEDNTVMEMLNTEEVQAGDVFFMPAGRVHAIGSGLLVAEIQQTSDVTYRIYDFNRKDADGNGRELHTELAVDAIDFTKEDNYRTAYEVKNNESSELVSCKYFTTNVLELTENIEMSYNKLDSFVIYMCLEGAYEIQWEEGTVEVGLGETVLVPASMENFTLKPKGQAKLLEVYIKENM
ncbi:class I mannose-6-phosphate isomerase [Halosquirtibacter xylanolyticus]|uniref:type I phosphomannose isomerase catalytic subunit n=1 Tax=Halosquirtibacter xylanolyticus TaxID=3374599 RepID=UPI0037496AC0|nr:class I mannose-6-phosphate isomerase [Prolixibacteraceae bacterium]